MRGGSVGRQVTLPFAAGFLLALESLEIGNLALSKRKYHAAKVEHTRPTNPTSYQVIKGTWD